LRGERELFTVARKSRERAIARPAGQTPGDASGFAHGVKFAGITENDLIAIGRGKPEEAGGFGKFLGGGGVIDCDHEQEHEPEAKKRNNAHKNKRMNEQAGAEPAT
jgi:hypothetical protein